MRRGFIAAVLLLSFLLAAAGSTLQGLGGEARLVHGVLVVSVKGVIDDSMARYIKSGLQAAEEQDRALLVLLDTPGGQLEAALNIVESFREATVPVISFVKGKWAVSAGTLLLLCSHVAAMQPGTVIGAMQPVILSPLGGYTPVNESKILNPVYKELEACLRLYGRNTTVAREMVYENLVLDAEEAYKSRVVDLLAPNMYSLLQKINGRRVKLLTGTVVLDTWPPDIVYYPMPVSLRVAHILGDPLLSSLLSTIALILIIAGVLTGHLHLIVPGIALMLLSMLGLGFSLNIAALVMIVAGIILLLVEILVIPGFTIVGATGIILLVLGLLMLPVPGPQTISPEYLTGILYTVAAATTPLAGLMAVIVYKVVKAKRQKVLYKPLPLGKQGYAVDDIPAGGEGFVFVEGEYWRARSHKPVKKGQRVRVVGKDGPVLLVEPLEEQREQGEGSERG